MGTSNVAKDEPESASRAARGFTVAEMRQVLDALTHIPRAWAIFILGAFAASLLELARSAEGSWTFSVRVTAMTVTLVGFLWLPLLLKVLALTGGGVKTSVGEASVNGVIDLFDLLKPSTTAIAALERLDEEGARPDLRQARQLVEQQVALLAPSAAEARRQLERIALSYEALRVAEDGSRTRTLKLSALMEEVRLLAASASLGTAEVLEMFGRAPSDPKRPDIAGHRAVAVRLMGISPSPSFLEPLLDAIEHRRSRFEQYYALGALESTLSMLDETQQKTVRDRLGAALASGKIENEADDNSRRRIADRICRTLAAANSTARAARLTST